MKRILISLVLASAMFSVGAMAQSAKFAAVWTDGLKVVKSEACDSTEDNFCDAITNTGAQFGTTLANIKVPQSKELLVGVSAQVELFTQTTVKGRKGSLSKATAMAEGGVSLLACNLASGDCFEGAPGYITLSKRQQELEAVLGGVIEECTFDVTLDVVEDVASGSATWTLDDCVVLQEEISLALTTMAAHHFNFVFPDLPQGDYAVMATFKTDATAAAEASCSADASYCDAEVDGDASAVSHAVIGKTMMTVQEVRAVKGSLGSMEFIDID
jgi:hypothetical protein